MTEPLIVPTAFGDLGELADGLVHRVGDNSLILYGPTPLNAGAGVEFQVLLLDDSIALQGTALVEEVFDGGEEREAETRYDIVLSNLQMDARSSVVFERILVNASENLDGAEANYAEQAQEVAVDETFEPELDTVDAFESLAPASTEVAGVDVATEFAEAAQFEDVGGALIDEGQEVAAEAFSDFAAPADFEVSPEVPGEEIYETFGQLEPEAFSAGDETVVAKGLGDDAAYADVGDVGVEAFDEIAVDDFAAEQDFSQPAETFEANEFVEVDAAEQPLHEEPPLNEEPIAPAHMPLESGSNGPLNRATFAALWSPTAPPIEPRPSTGWFAYGAGALPAPSGAPRPEIAPELRVAPAPVPTPEMLEALTAQEAARSAPIEAAVEATTEFTSDVVESETMFESIEPEAAMEVELGGGPEESDFQEMPLPDNAEIAPAVESEFVSVSDVDPIEDDEIRID